MRLSEIFKKIHIFKKQTFFDKHPLAFLNGAQFLGALNDNIFKLLIVYALIDTRGIEKANSILALAGAIYVIPFLLFSSAAGVIADRFSKQKIIVIIKSIEIIIMVCGAFSLLFKNEFLCYATLFFLSTHSALFGPCKYGIIPEIVKKDEISKANGIITATTYIAIIVGTFLASFITQLTNRNFFVAGLFCIFISLLGFAFALFLKSTEAQDAKKKINLLFLREIFKTLREIKDRQYLLLSVLSAAFFLFIGSFAQLNIIPFALQSLHLPEIGGGYLFLVTAIGIALGSLVGGKASKHAIELGGACLACLGMALFFFLLALLRHYLWPVVVCLLFLGFCGGIYVIPFDAFIQTHSPNNKRGQVIAATNFLSFLGVLLASLSLYVSGEIFELGAWKGFVWVGFLLLIVFFILIFFLSDVFYPFMSRKVTNFLYQINPYEKNFLKNEPNMVLIIKESNYMRALLLLRFYPNVQFYWLTEKSRKIPAFADYFLNIPTLDFQSKEKIHEKLKESFQKNKTPCFLLPKNVALPLQWERQLSYPLFEINMEISQREVWYKKKSLRLIFSRFSKR